MKWLTYSERTAIFSGERSISYAQLAGMTSSAAKAMAGKCSAGDRVMLIGANSPEWVIAMLASWHIHAIAVPVDFMSTAEEIAYIIGDCKPAVIWCAQESREKLNGALSIASSTMPFVMGMEQIKNMKEDSAGAHSVGENNDADLALIIYTSGTTGFPKGVMLSFENLKANAEACTVQTKVFIPEDRVLVVLPLHHSYPLMASVVMPMYIGAASVFAQNMTSDAIMSALRDHKCTFIIGVPRLLELFRNSMMRRINGSKIAKILFYICAACGSLRLSRYVFGKVQKAFGGCIRYISSGGAAADPHMVRDFYALGFHLLEGYGMTETAPMISFTPPWKHKPGSPGKPIPCNEVKIADGEVLVRGCNVMKGYYGKPEETSLVIDSEGWLHTGDLGYVDKDGFLFLTGRSKELIILGNGKNIAPYELEKKLTDMSGGLFSECVVTDDGRHLAVIAVPDKEAAASRGIVNIRQTILDEIIEPYNEAAPTYKRIPNLILRTSPLPRTRLGKLRRHLIRQELAGMAHTDAKEGAADEKPAPESDIYVKLEKIVEKLAGRIAGPDEHLELDLGLDSMAKLTLASDIEQELGLAVPPPMLAAHPSLRSLSEVLQNTECPPRKTAGNQKTALPLPSCTHGLFKAVSSLIQRIICRLKVTGKENIPQGPCVFAPNHQSIIDGMCLASVLDYARFKNTYFYAISKFISSPVMKFLARRHNVIAMEINGDLLRSLNMLLTALRSGKSVVIFPEGTRSMDGALSEFYPTFAKLAMDAGVPVVPVAISGAYEVLPRGRRFPAFGKTVKLSFLPPIMVTEKPEAACAAVKKEIAKSLK